MIKVIVFGSFDPLHKGHQNLFKQAKALGDYLVVVVASDDKIRHNKKRKPRLNISDRINDISADPNVDEVIAGDSGLGYTALDKIKPDIIALGYDQKVPEEIKKIINKYETVVLKPYKTDIYKSSLIHNKKLPT